MYLHQVIADALQIPTADLFYKSNLTDRGKFIDRLSRSQRFHIPSLDKTIQLFGLDENDAREQLIKDYCYMPFKHCWFDFAECFDGKAGMYVTQHEERDFVFSVVPFASLGRWESLPFTLQVYINRRNFDEFDSYIINVSSPWEDTEFAEWVHNWGHLCGGDPETFGEIALDIGIILNVKGVSTKKIKASTRLNHKRRKSNKLPLFDYHVLTIKPLNEATEYILSSPGSQKRPHWRRGSVARYKKPKLLFGKYEGLFYRKPCKVRRNRKGLVLKSYKIAPPESD